MTEQNKASGSPPQILIVEDSMVEAELLRRTLTRAGYAVSTATNGEEGLRVARALRPALVMSDINMPIMDGYQLCLAIKYDEDLWNTPLILLTVLSEPEDIIKAINSGADAYIIKPYSEAILLSRIRSLLDVPVERRQADERRREVVDYGGTRHTLRGGGQQVLNLLLSLYENTLSQNRELVNLQTQLNLLNDTLDRQVRERTATLIEAETDRHRLSEALHQTLQPVILLDLENSITYVNPAFTDLLGYGLKDLSGQLVDRLCPPDPASRAQKAATLQRVREVGYWSGEVLRLHRNGAPIPVFANISVLRAADGTPTGFVGTLFDLRPLRDSQDQLHAVCDATTDALIVIDDQGGVTRWNAAAERMFGYTGEEILGIDLHQIIVPERDRASYLASFPHFQATGQGRNIGVPRERLALHKDGHGIPVEVAISSLRLRGRWHAVGIVRDITERRRAAELLLQSQKMDAIGQLTGGIAHDFNNLLGVVIGNLDLVRESLSDDPDRLELVDAALDAALRGAELNKRLLASARRQSLLPKKVHVGDTLDDIVKLLKRTLGERIEVSLVPDRTAWPITVDPSQFENAIVNLGINARDAMPGGGHLTIESWNLSADAVFVENHIGMSPGDYVVISVSDSGDGMTPEVLSHVFEPFYTTKPIGKGTGLGLSMVHGFVNQSGGHVSIYSETGKGTTVRLYLPRCHDDESADPAVGSEEEVSPPAEAGQLLVLVVDDNPGILRVTIRQLTDLGYRTREANNADEALALAGQGVAPDILFTDIVMPGSMDGLELADRLRAVMPDLSVLLCSGFTERAAIDARKREGRTIAAPLLTKPFRKDDLARALAALRRNPKDGVSSP